MDAYTTADLQTARGIAIQAGNLTSLIAALDKEINFRIEKSMSPARENVSQEISCPSCGLGHLFICQQTSALTGYPVMVCSRHCGYSEVARG